MRCFSLWQNLSCLIPPLLFHPGGLPLITGLLSPPRRSPTTAGPHAQTPRAFCIPLSAHRLEVEGVVPWGSSPCLPPPLPPHRFQQRFETNVIFRDAWVPQACKRSVHARKTCTHPASPRGCLCLTSEVHGAAEVTHEVCGDLRETTTVLGTASPCMCLCVWQGHIHQDAL